MGTDSHAVNRPPHSLQHVDTWLFDLDNTLYPPTCNLQQQMAARAQQLLCDVLEVSPAEAHELIMTYMHEYGTALHGLHKHHGVTPDSFFKCIHEVDYTVVKADPALDVVLNNLRPAAQLGMTTVWVRNGSEFSHGTVDEHVHVIADDLVSWLQQVARKNLDLI